MSRVVRSRQLGDPACLTFPFRVGAGGPATSRRAAHVRDQIEQVLFTLPGERVFRPDFGAGLEALVFEPNQSPLWELTRRRIQAALAQALKGEVDPASLQIDVRGQEERLTIEIRFRLTALGVEHAEQFTVGGGADG